MASGSLWATTADGVFKSDDYGEQWKAISFGALKDPSLIISGTHIFLLNDSNQRLRRMDLSGGTPIDVTPARCDSLEVEGLDDTLTATCDHDVKIRAIRINKSSNQRSTSAQTAVIPGQQSKLGRIVLLGLSVSLTSATF